MKTINIVIIILIFSLKGNTQAHTSDEKLIRSFLNYVNSPEWNLDTIDTKYIVKYPNGADASSNDRRRKFLKIQVVILKNHLKGVDLSTVKVIPYRQAPEAQQILTIGEDFAARSYVISDSRSFTRYILIKESQIEAFDLWQRSYWLMD